MKQAFARTDLPERLQYTKYYEHDGMLRAYANRAMLLAMLFGVIAVASLTFAIYVRLQPPTIVRIDQDGNSTALAAKAPEPKSSGLSILSVQAAADPALSDLEAKAVVRR